MSDPASTPRIPCTHDLVEREVAVADGYCPICMQRELSEARAEIERLKESERYAWKNTHILNEHMCQQDKELRELRAALAKLRRPAPSEPVGYPVGYAVIDAECDIITTFIDRGEEDAKQAAHDFINKTIQENEREGFVKEVAKWVVRPLFLAPPSGIREGMLRAAEICENAEWAMNPRGNHDKELATLLRHVAQKVEG